MHGFKQPAFGEDLEDLGPAYFLGFFFLVLALLGLHFGFVLPLGGHHVFVLDADLHYLHEAHCDRAEVDFLSAELDVGDGLVDTEGDEDVGAARDCHWHFEGLQALLLVLFGDLDYGHSAHLPWGQFGNLLGVHAEVEAAGELGVYLEVERHFASVHKQELFLLGCADDHVALVQCLLAPLELLFEFLPEGEALLLETFQQGFADLLPALERVL